MANLSALIVGETEAIKIWLKRLDAANTEQEKNSLFIRIRTSLAYVKDMAERVELEKKK